MPRQSPWILLLFIGLGASPISRAGKLDPQPLDGVEIEAVQDYLTPSNDQIALRAAVYPFNAFFTGLGVNVSYLHFFGNTVGWEAVNFTYLMSARKALTQQLANDFGVNPQEIEKLELVLSSNLVFNILHGKYVLFGSAIKYFRCALLAGPAFLSTNKSSTVAIGAGAAVEVHISDRFSWSLEIRDHLGLKGGDSFVAFFAGTSLYF